MLTKLAAAQWMNRDGGNCSMMPVHCTDCAMRPVWIHHFFPIPTARWIFITALAIRISIANNLHEVARNLSRALTGRGRTDFSKKPPCHTYRMNLISAQSISLDSTFNNCCRDPFEPCNVLWALLYVCMYYKQYITAEVSDVPVRDWSNPAPPPHPTLLLGSLVTLNRRRGGVLL